MKVWLHGSSLGDIYALRALTLAFAQQGHSLVVSACTKSGKEAWQSLLSSTDLPINTNIKLLPAPLWSHFHAQTYIEQENPNLLILELLELWPSWIKTWSKAGIPIIVVDGRISARTLKARFYLKSCFSRLSLFLAQTKLDAERATYMGCLPERVHVCGDAKLDSLLMTQTQLPSKVDHCLFNLILGCTRTKDEKKLVKPLTQYLNQRKTDRVLIAPRHLETTSRLIKRLKQANLTYSILTEADFTRVNVARVNVARVNVDSHKTWIEQRVKHEPAQVWILNTYGELSGMYKYAHSAIIGGTFYNHGQNLLEAAQAGCAVIHGPNITKQRAQLEFISAQGTYSVLSWKDAFSCAQTLQNQSKAIVGVQANALDSARGVSEQQMQLIKSLI